MDGRYLVGFDGSGPALAALGWATRQARHDAAPLVLVHVVDDEFGVMGATWARDAAEAASRQLEEAARALAEQHPRLAVSCEQLTGSVAGELARAAGPEDVLVVGTHKTGFLHGRVLGSRSVQLAAAARAQLVVVPEVDLRFRRGVVAGIDRIATAAPIARRAARAAWQRDDELVLLQSLPGGGEGLRRDELAISVAIAAAHEECPELVIRSRVSGRPATEALLDAARDKALLVLGPGDLEGVRSPIGSVLHDVLLNVTAPVLVVRSAASAESPGLALARPARE